MKRRRLLAVVLAACALALVAAACGGGDGEPSGGADTTGDSDGGQPTKGGTYRISTTQFNHTGSFDPTGEYLGTDLGLFSNLLVRTLVGYEHKSGAAGNAVVPDLATDMGEVS
jgi:peptide/nickel transport system substrate-binding protein